MPGFVSFALFDRREIVRYWGETKKGETKEEVYVRV